MGLNMVLLQSKIDALVRRNNTFYKNSRSFHDALKLSLMRLATEFGYEGKTEYKVPKGLVDVVWVDDQNQPVLAIEIDSSLKSKSVEKLATMPDDVERIWICYSPKEINIEDYENLIRGHVMKYELPYRQKKGRM